MAATTAAAVGEGAAATAAAGAACASLILCIGGSRSSSVRLGVCVLAVHHLPGPPLAGIARETTAECAVSVDGQGGGERGGDSPFDGQKGVDIEQDGAANLKLEDFGANTFTANLMAGPSHYSRLWAGVFAPSGKGVWCHPGPAPSVLPHGVALLDSVLNACCKGGTGDDHGAACEPPCRNLKFGRGHSMSEQQRQSDTHSLLMPPSMVVMSDMIISAVSCSDT